MPKLWAIADIHLSFKSNRDEWAKLKHRQDDGLILAGDGMLPGRFRPTKLAARRAQLT